MGGYQQLELEDPTDGEFFGIDYANRLNSGETVSSVVWTIAPAGLTQSDVSATTTRASVKLTGGVAGGRYLVSCQATMNTGEKKTGRFYLLIVFIP